MISKTIKNLLIISLLTTSIISPIPVFAETYVVYSSKEITSGDGIETVTEIQKLSDNSIKEIKTQSNGFVLEHTYYPDGSATDKIYEDGILKSSRDYGQGEYIATYRTLNQSMKIEYDDNIHNSERMGNTNGNFSQGNPIMAYENGNIYYIDSYSDGTFQSCIYKMDSNGNNITSITGYSDIKYQNLNVLDGYLYYLDTRREEIVKMKVDGTDKKVIYNGKVVNMIVYDKYIYFTDSNNKKIYRMNTNGDGREEIVDYSDYLSCSFMNIEGQYIYYNIDVAANTYWTDVETYRINLDGSNKQLIKTKRTKEPFPQVYENSIYALKSGVVKFDNDTEKVIITQQNGYHIKFFNIYDGWIYYVKESTSYNQYEGERLYKCRLDGSDETFLYEAESPNNKYNGIGQKISGINVVKDWISIQITDRNREYSGIKRVFIKADGSKTIPFENSMTMNVNSTGWVKIRGLWYYYNNDGSKKTGWFEDYDGKWYYFDEDGIMVRNQFIGVYYLGSDGVWK